MAPVHYFGSIVFNNLGICFSLNPQSNEYMRFVQLVSSNQNPCPFGPQQRSAFQISCLWLNSRHEPMRPFRRSILSLPSWLRSFQKQINPVQR
jgi:hypothetical protein